MSQKTEPSVEPAIRSKELSKEDSGISQHGAEMIDLLTRNNQLESEVKETHKSHTTTYLGIIVALATVAMFLGYLAFVRFPQNTFIATQNAAALCSVPSIKRPHVSEAIVADFARGAVVSIYSYSYLSYRQNIVDAADKYFTDSFHDTFITLFSNSQTLKAVIDKRFIVTAAGTANQPPMIRRAGERMGAWAWIVDVPVTVYYVSGRESHEDRMLASVTVTQTDPTRTNAKGIGVDNIELRQALN